ncbi:MAG: hypothetical protein SGJ13_14330 [Actinomycetota bacterium]|nr:hypothetical protein [Actinomycetota bacterium]
MARAEIPDGLPLSAIAARVQPFVAARERLLPVALPLGNHLPNGGVQRGTTVVVDGRRGVGVTTTTLMLAAAATTTGEWAAIVDPDGTVGARAAADAGVELERCAVVRRVPRDRWSAVVAALLDGAALVAATVPDRLRPGDARRLIAKARERSSVLVAVGPWPVEAALRLHVEPSAWERASSGLLTRRDIVVHVEGRGVRAPMRLAHAV